MKLEEFEKKLNANPKFRKEFNKIDLAFEISEMLIDARIMKGITQKRLAKLLNTKQPSIARAERGKHLPSLRFLENVAKVLGTYLLPPRFGFMINKEIIAENSGTSESKVSNIFYSPHTEHFGQIKSFSDNNSRYA